LPERSSVLVLKQAFHGKVYPHMLRHATAYGRRMAVPQEQGRIKNDNVTLDPHAGHHAARNPFKRAWRAFLAPAWRTAVQPSSARASQARSVAPLLQAIQA